jgi:hypothetical protein
MVTRCRPARRNRLALERTGRGREERAGEACFSVACTCVVPAETPTIVATSIGFPSRQRGSLDLRAGPIYRFAAELARPRGTPRLCLLATANGDAADRLVDAYTALREVDVRVSHVSLFPMPNVPDVRAHLLSQDVIWVAVAAWSTCWPCGVRTDLTAFCTSAGSRAS